MPLEINHIDQQIGEKLRELRARRKTAYEEHGNDPPTRRRALLHVTPDVFAHMTNGCFKVVANPLPADARVVGAFYNDQRHAFGIAVDSEEFEPVKLGDLLPDLPSPVIQPLVAGVEEIDKLRAVALAAESFVKVFHEFDGDPSCTGEHLYALDAALERIGEERLSRMRYGG